MSFKIGDRVFVSGVENLRLRTYYTGNDGIPNDLLEHGTTTVDKKYLVEGGIIKNIYDARGVTYYLVEIPAVRKNSSGNYRTILGYKLEQLKYIAKRLIL